MGKHKKKKPEIRFKGFTDDWEQRKLGDYIIEYQEVTTENNQYPPLTSSRKGIFLQKDYFAGNQIASTDNTGYNIVPFGYFTYRHMSDDEIFHFNINDIIENGIVSTLYPVFTTTKGIDSKYLQYQLNHGYEFTRYALSQKQGGSRTYMYLNKLKMLHITIPTAVKEQKAIANCLMKIDNLITLHQRKLNKLKKVKKSMLEKMFPQNGEMEPQIRFCGFISTWEQCKLGEVVAVYDGVHQTPEYQSHGIMFLSVEDIFTMKSNKYITEDAFERDFRIFPQKGDILMTRIGDVGTTNVVETSEKIAFYVSLALLKPNGINSYFLSNAIESNAFQKGLREHTLQSAIPQKINKDEIGKVDIFVTSMIDEQAKIGKIFRNLDNLITLHQRKLEKLNKIKKAMLEKMFV